MVLNWGSPIRLVSAAHKPLQRAAVAIETILKPGPDFVPIPAQEDDLTSRHRLRMKEAAIPLSGRGMGAAHSGRLWKPVADARTHATGLDATHEPDSVASDETTPPVMSSDAHCRDSR